MGITSKRGGRERSERGRGRRKKGRGGRGRRSASKLNDNSYEKPEWQIINTNTKKIGALTRSIFPVQQFINPCS